MALKRSKNFKIHVGLVLAEIICASAFVVEIRRAISGNELSWAYVFEWPLFAGYAVYMWHKLINEDAQTPPTRKVPQEPRTDEALANYNDYLRGVHSKSSKKTEEY